jgi:hypothetical protein
LPRSMRALSHPAGRAAGGKAKALGHGISGEDLLKAVLHSFHFLISREPAPRSGGLRDGTQFWWSWRVPCRFRSNTRGTQHCAKGGFEIPTLS